MDDLTQVLGSLKAILARKAARKKPFSGGLKTQTVFPEQDPVPDEERQHPLPTGADIFAPVREGGIRTGMNTPFTTTAPYPSPREKVATRFGISLRGGMERPDGTPIPADKGSFGALGERADKAVASGMGGLDVGLEYIPAGSTHVGGMRAFPFGPGVDLSPSSKNMLARSFTPLQSWRNELDAKAPEAFRLSDPEGKKVARMEAHGGSTDDPFFTAGLVAPSMGAGMAVGGAATKLLTSGIGLVAGAGAAEGLAGYTQLDRLLKAKRATNIGRALQAHGPGQVASSALAAATTGSEDESLILPGKGKGVAVLEDLMLGAAPPVAWGGAKDAFGFARNKLGIPAAPHLNVDEGYRARNAAARSGVEDIRNAAFPQAAQGTAYMGDPSVTPLMTPEEISSRAATLRAERHAAANPPLQGPLRPYQGPEPLGPQHGPGIPPRMQGPGLPEGSPGLPRQPIQGPLRRPYQGPGLPDDIPDHPAEDRVAELRRVIAEINANTEAAAPAAPPKRTRKPRTGAIDPQLLSTLGGSAAGGVAGGLTTDEDDPLGFWGNTAVGALAGGAGGAALGRMLRGEGRMAGRAVGGNRRGSISLSSPAPAVSLLDKAIANLDDSPIPAYEFENRMPKGNFPDPKGEQVGPNPVRSQTRPAILKEMQDRGLTAWLAEKAARREPVTKAEIQEHLKANPYRAVSDEAVAPFPAYSKGIRVINESEPEGTPKYWIDRIKKNVRKGEWDETGFGEWLEEKHNTEPSIPLSRNEVAEALKTRLPELVAADRGVTAATKALTAARREIDDYGDTYRAMESEALNAMERAGLTEGADWDRLNHKDKSILADMEGADKDDIAIVREFFAAEPPHIRYPKDHPGRTYQQIERPKMPNYRIPGKLIPDSEGDLVTAFNQKQRAPLEVGEKFTTRAGTWTVMDVLHDQNAPNDPWVMRRHDGTGEQHTDKMSFLQEKSLEDDPVTKPFVHRVHTGDTKNPLGFSRVRERLAGYGKKALVADDVQSDHAQQGTLRGWIDKLWPGRKAALEERRPILQGQHDEVQNEWISLRDEILRDRGEMTETEHYDRKRELQEQINKLRSDAEDELVGKMNTPEALRQKQEDPSTFYRMVTNHVEKGIRSTPQYKKLQRELMKLGRGPKPVSDAELVNHPKGKALVERGMSVADERQDLNKALDPVPGHLPFRNEVMSTETILKRLFDEANQRGDVDWIVLPTGKQVNDMANLGTQVDHVEWNPRTREFIGTRGQGKDKVEVWSSDAGGRKELISNIGKENVERLLSGGTNERGVFTLSGDDIGTVGGSANLRYYDSMGTKVKDLGKKIGIDLTVEPLTVEGIDHATSMHIKQALDQEAELRKQAQTLQRRSTLDGVDRKDEAAALWDEADRANATAHDVLDTFTPEVRGAFVEAYESGILGNPAIRWTPERKQGTKTMPIYTKILTTAGAGAAAGALAPRKSEAQGTDDEDGGIGAGAIAGALGALGVGAIAGTRKGRIAAIRAARAVGKLFPGTPHVPSGPHGGPVPGGPMPGGGVPSSTPTAGTVMPGVNPPQKGRTTMHDVNGPVDVRDHLNFTARWQEFASDPTGKLALERQAAEAIHEHGVANAKPVTFDDIRAKANRLLGMDPEELLEAARKRGLKPEEQLHAANIVAQNMDNIVRYQAMIEDPTVPRVQREAIKKTLDAVQRQTNSLLSTHLTAGTEAGRNLAYQKIAAQRTMDPTYWLAQAQKNATRALTPDQMSEVMRFINAKDRMGLASFVASLKPGKWGRLTGAFFRAGLLWNPPTHAANLVSNVGMAGLETAKDAPAAAGDIMLTKLLTAAMGDTGPVEGLKRSRDFAPLSSLAATGRGAVEGAKTIPNVMMGRDAPLASEMGKFDVHEEVRTGNRVVDGYLNGPLRFLRGADNVFKEAAFMRSLAQKRRLAGMPLAKSVESALEGVSPEMVNEAAEDARVATFQNESLLGTMGSRARAAMAQHGGQVGEAAGTVILPFTQTPGAVGSAIVRYSPLALGRAGANVMELGYKAAQARSNAARIARMRGVETPETVQWNEEQLKAQVEAIQALKNATVDRLGRGVTGSAVIAMGAALAAAGIIKARPGQNDQTGRTMGEVSGDPGGSFDFGPLTGQIDRISPVGNLLMLGAYAYQGYGDKSTDKEIAALEAKHASDLSPLEKRQLATLKTEKEEGTASGSPLLNAGMTMIGGIGTTLTDQPFLSGVKRVTDALGNPRGVENAGAALGKGLVNTAGSFIPSVVASGARTIDPTKRAPEGLGQTLLSRIPGLSDRVPAKLDALGTEINEPLGVRLANAVSPVRFSTDRTEGDEVRKMIVDLGVPLTALKQEKGETPEEFRTRQEVTGKAIRDRIALMMPIINAKPEAERATYVKEQVAKARASAKKQVEFRMMQGSPP